jgi:acetyl-CoA C-acetyltransferase
VAEALIYDAVRTPRGKGKSSGSLHTVRPVELLSCTLRALRDRNELDTSQVDDVIAGCVTQSAEQGSCIARFAALSAGYDHSACGVTINRFCASGLEAVNQAAAMVASGFADIIVAGGVESMSRVPMGSDGGAVWDAQTQWEVGSVPQGISADLLATLRGITRADADRFAAQSQTRAAAALAAGAFARSVVPVTDQNGLTILDHDEYPREGTTTESLATLKPAFEMIGRQFALDHLTKAKYPQVSRVDHVHTAGNSSGIVDGAAALLIGNAAKGKSLGLKPRARIKALAATGSEPILMLDGPIPATHKVLARSGMKLSDIDLFEVNEAFASVPLAYMQEFEIDPARVNLHGGAIALGHPLGATGAMLVGTALDLLEERDQTTALITLCIGGGMGVATIVERL